MGSPPRHVGVYVHVPVCAARCDYCAFSVATGKDHLKADYLKAVLDELAVRLFEEPVIVDTVYLGGGTPSELAPEQLAALLDAIPLVPGGECSVECHPDDVTDELVATLAAHNVTRVSLGVESLVAHVRNGLGRQMREGALEEALWRLHEHEIDEVNVDLIFGGYSESPADLETSIVRLVSMEPAPSHVSCYALTVEPGTALWRDPSRQPNEDDLASAYLMCNDLLGEAGYFWYEISNFALSGHECAHNLNYWRQGDYLGFGPSAHSHLAGTRSRNVFSLDRYLERHREARSFIAATETLTQKARQIERLELSLRTPSGVPLTAIRDLGAVAQLIDTDGITAVLNAKGRLLMDEVARRLVVEDEAADNEHRSAYSPA